MRFLAVLAAWVPFLVWAPAVAAKPDAGTSHSVRALGGLGVSSLGSPGVQLAGQLDYWLSPRLGLGGDVGALMAAGLRTSSSLHAGVSGTLRSATGPRHWLVSANLGPGYAEAHQTWCTDDFSWNEGSCEDSDWIGWGAHFGAQAGRMGGSDELQLGLLLRADYTTPKLALVSLNFAVGWD